MSLVIRNHKGRFVSTKNGTSESNNIQQMTENNSHTITEESNDTDTLTQESDTTDIANEGADHLEVYNPGNDELPPKPPEVKPEEPAPTPTPQPKKQTNTLLDNLLKPTDKDLGLKNLGDLANDIRNKKEDNDTDDDDDDDTTNTDNEGEYDVSPQLRRKKAKIKATIKVNSAALALDKVCCLITGDWSSGRYKVSEDEKKMIRDPLYQLELLKQNKKSTNPGVDLLVCCLIVIVPILISAFVDAFKKSKEKKEAKAKEAEAEKQRQEQAVIDRFKISNNNGITTIKEPGNNFQPQQTEQPPQSEQQKENKPSTKKGRHAVTCPRHKDKTAECNCKK